MTLSAFTPVSAHLWSLSGYLFVALRKT